MATESSPYRVLVRDLPASRRIEITPELVAETVKGLPMRDALDDGGAAVAGDGGVGECDLYGDADASNVQVHARIHGHVTVACSRCVGPVRIPVSTLRQPFGGFAPVQFGPVGWIPTSGTSRVGKSSSRTERSSTSVATSASPTQRWWTPPG